MVGADPVSVAVFGGVGPRVAGAGRGAGAGVSGTIDRGHYAGKVRARLTVESGGSIADFYIIESMHPALLRQLNPALPAIVKRCAKRPE